jgi:hypothetical protein
MREKERKRKGSKRRKGIWIIKERRNTYITSGSPIGGPYK